MESINKLELTPHYPQLVCLVNHFSQPHYKSWFLIKKPSRDLIFTQSID